MCTIKMHFYILEHALEFRMEYVYFEIIEIFEIGSFHDWNKIYGLTILPSPSRIGTRNLDETQLMEL